MSIVTLTSWKTRKIYESRMNIVNRLFLSFNLIASLYYFWMNFVGLIFFFEQLIFSKKPNLCLLTFFSFCLKSQRTALE